MSKKPAIKLLEDKILVRVHPQATESAGGIVLPTTGKPKQYTSTVVYTGPGLKDEPLTVKVGDTVLHPFLGTEYTVADEQLQLLRESDLVGILPA